jgi:hypothetical protein
MITTKIKIKDHLAEYIRGKYNNCHDGPVNIPSSSDLYVTIWDLMTKRPVNAGKDEGNLEIALPSRSHGKKPEYYNYLSKRAAGILEKLIESMLYAEIHHHMRTNKRAGLNYLDTVYYFISEYGITSISEDAFIKEYYRLRRNHYNREKRLTKIARNYG